MSRDFDFFIRRCLLRFDTMLVSYNRMGGHRAISFAGNLLIGLNPPSFGAAIGSIEVYCHIDDPEAPAPALDFLVNRYFERVRTMPFGTFYRKAKRFDLALHSSLHTNQSLIGYDPHPATDYDVTLVRTIYREIASALEILRGKIKKSDDFDGPAFFAYIKNQVSNLDNSSVSAILKQLHDLHSAEQKRVASYQPVEKQTTQKTESRSKTKLTKRKMPSWKTPKNLAKTLEDGDGMWEDERWSPIKLTAMSGTEYKGREIPVAWQIEFSPLDDGFESANDKIEALELESDGYGWGEFLFKEILKTNRPLAKRLHLTDCETETCVIWVESEDDCRALLEAAWKLIFHE